MSEDDHTIHERWARLRFAVIGPLLMAPPEPGELAGALAALSTKTWRHPATGAPVRFGFSTLERWYYAARAAQRDPVGALRPRRRADAGIHRRLSTALTEALTAQYRRHPSWSVQLHVDNLATVVRETPTLGSMPSYATVRRYLRAHGLSRLPRRRRRATAGSEAAERRLAEREVRSYELAYLAVALLHAPQTRGEVGQVGCGVPLGGRREVGVQGPGQQDLAGEEHRKEDDAGPSHCREPGIGQGRLVSAAATPR